MDNIIVDLLDQESKVFQLFSKDEWFSVQLVAVLEYDPLLMAPYNRP